MLTGSPALSWIASAADRSKVSLPGTDRARPAADTLALARRAAGLVGITRVADITRLDTIGIPTYQAIRPLSRTVAVSQGKGLTAELAELSAILESVETWHVEQPMPAVRRAAARDLDVELGYDVAALAPSGPSLLHDGLPLDWLAARSLRDGAGTLVPLDTVRLTLEQPAGWQPPAFFASTNGLASGNTLVEAALHGLYEVIERDATTAAVRRGDRGTRIDPGSLASARVDGLQALLERAGVRLESRLVPSPTGLPCMLAWVSCPDYPAAMFGFGCNLSPEIALVRAITEAAQTRLAYIAGARDDLADEIDPAGARRRDEPLPPAVDVRTLLPPPEVRDSLAEDLEHVVARAAAAFGSPPLLVELTRPGIGIPVVKVVAPGARICPEVL